MWDAIADLCYTQHGGSGLHLGGLDQVLALPFDKLNFLREYLHNRREEEVEAIKKAGK